MSKAKQSSGKWSKLYDELFREGEIQVVNKYEKKYSSSEGIRENESYSNEIQFLFSDAIFYLSGWENYAGKNEGKYRFSQALLVRIQFNTV